MGQSLSPEPATCNPARNGATRPPVGSIRPPEMSRSILRFWFSRSDHARDIPRFVGLVLFGLVWALAATSVRAEDNWLLDQKTDFEQFLADLKSKEVLAQGVLDQARRAEAKAIQLEDQEALPIARQAIDLAQQGVAEAQKRVARQAAKVDALDRARQEGPHIRAAVTEIRGQVFILKKQNGKFVPLQSAAVIQPGEAVRTGRNGSMEVIFQDGSRILLSHNSEFHFTPEEKEQGALYRLRQGLMHIFGERRYKVRSPAASGGGLRGQLPRYEMPTAVAGVRGTEFDLRVDNHGLTHLITYSGTVELTALPEAMAKVKLDRWWEKGKAVAAKPLPESKLLRVALTQGDVKIEGNGTSRIATAGEHLADGEKVATGENGFARIELVDGAQGALAANTRLEVKAQGTPEAVRYEIQQGRMHAVISKKTGARLIEIATPNAVLKGQGAEFEVSVDGQGLADVIPLSATVEVTAQRDNLDTEKIKSWWEEP